MFIDKLPEAVSEKLYRFAVTRALSNAIEAYGLFLSPTIYKRDT